MNLRHIAAVVAVVAPLWGCPPNLTGERCDNDCHCPGGQTCVLGGGDSGTCQDGVNTCGVDGGTGDGGVVQFGGVVVLNGSAAPINGAMVYGYADGLPDLDGGEYVGADLSQAVDNSGAFAFRGSVPLATGTGYRFAAVYDCNPGSDLNVDHTGVFSQMSGNQLAPQSPDGTSLRIDVQTSTCFSITTDFGQVPGGATFLLGIGANAYDTHTGGPLTLQSDFDSVSATFDAGSAIPDGGGLAGAVPLTPFGTIPGINVANAWFFAKVPAPQLSNQGDFYVLLSDARQPKPQYPLGTCTVSYGPPPGFPGSLTLNNSAIAPIWQTTGSGGVTNTVAWQDFAGQLPDGVTWVGDLLSIVAENTQQQLYPAPDAGLFEFVTSPQVIRASAVPRNVCDIGTFSYCAVEVTSLYKDARKLRSTAYEGGTTLLLFQRDTSGG